MFNSLRLSRLEATLTKAAYRRSDHALSLQALVGIHRLHLGNLAALPGHYIYSHSTEPQRELRVIGLVNQVAQEWQAS